MDWTHDGSLIVGETNRGWGSAGNKDEGIQRLEWTGKLPFEMKTVKATTDGFEIEFTKPAKMHDIKDLVKLKLIALSISTTLFMAALLSIVRRSKLKVSSGAMTD